MSEHFDGIVIGSGAGGGTLTHALTPTGKRILLLERGGLSAARTPELGSPVDLGDQRYRNSGDWRDARTGRNFMPNQHYYVGGDTRVYSAILFRFRERDFGEI